MDVKYLSLYHLPIVTQLTVGLEKVFIPKFEVEEKKTKVKVIVYIDR